MRRLFSALIGFLLLFSVVATPSPAKLNPVLFSKDRNQVIAFILSRQLAARHFGHEQLADPLSKKIFDLYIRQLDPRKRFLTLADMRELEAFSTLIDDELKRGKIVLPDKGREILNARIEEVARWIDPILDQGFDYAKQESLEADPKKLAFAAGMDELRERWRLSLKMQVLERYFELIETKQKEQPQRYAAIDPSKHPQEMEEALRKVRESSHRALQRLLKQSRQDHYDRYYDAIARAYDPHSAYMPPNLKEDFDIQMSGSLQGIGAMLREDDGLIKVQRVMPGGAAEKQGQLQAGDVILSVAEKQGEPVDISEMRIREAVSLIRGPKGTEVRLTVQKPGGGRLLIPIVRDVVRIEETYVKSALLPGEDGRKLGYIRIPAFYRDFAAEQQGGEERNATDDTRKALDALKKQGISGLILDLRNNGGGALTDAVDISGLFLPGGPVVQVSDAENNVKVLSDDEETVHFAGPMIVLVNQFSASASEILAAALQDYGRALIIGGEHTHGKGTVQAMMDLNRFLSMSKANKLGDLGALKLTFQKFYRINGDSTQFKGVEPDLVAPSMLDPLESGEKYMDYALPWDQVQATAYAPWHGPRFDRAQAISEGQKWVAANAGFSKIKEQSAKAKVRAKDTRVIIAAESMWNERQSLAAARKEAEDAGVLESGEDRDENSPMPKPQEEKQLDEILAKDPFVQLSQHLFNTVRIKQ